MTSQSRASLAERASVRTGPGPRLRLVPPTWSASSRVTLAPSWRPCMAAVTPAGPPPITNRSTSPVTLIARGERQCRRR